MEVICGGVEIPVRENVEVAGEFWARNHMMNTGLNSMKERGKEGEKEGRSG